MCVCLFVCLFVFLFASLSVLLIEATYSRHLQVNHCAIACSRQQQPSLLFATSAEKLAAPLYLEVLSP